MLITVEFQTKILSESISHLVEAIFHYQGFQPEHSMERVVPTGHLFILFELDDMTRHTFDPESLKPDAEYQKAWVSGVRDDHLSISAHPDSEMLVIQFKPAGAFPLFQHPLEKLANKVISGDSLFDGALLDLRDSIYRAATTDDKLQLAEDWVITNVDEDLQPPSEFVQLVERIYREPSTRLRDLTVEYPATQKHLIDQFKKYIGITPKRLQRIVRFNAILQQIHTSESLEWTEVAAMCGYSDQSHFIREFRAFSGFNPSEFLDQKFDDQEPNFFPLDKESEEPTG